MACPSLGALNAPQLRGWQAVTANRRCHLASRLHCRAHVYNLLTVVCRALQFTEHQFLKGLSPDVVDPKCTEFRTCHQSLPSRDRAPSTVPIMAMTKTSVIFHTDLRPPVGCPGHSLASRFSPLQFRSRPDKLRSYQRPPTPPAAAINPLPRNSELIGLRCRRLARKVLQADRSAPDGGRCLIDRASMARIGKGSASGMECDSRAWRRVMRWRRA